MQQLKPGDKVLLPYNVIGEGIGIVLYVKFHEHASPSGFYAKVCLENERQAWDFLESGLVYQGAATTEELLTHSHSAVRKIGIKRAKKKA